MIYSSEAMPLLLNLLSKAAFDIKKEVAYVLGNICVAPTEGSGRPNVILDHLVNLVRGGCLTGFLDLVRSADVEAARLGLQFIELVSREWLLLINLIFYLLIFSFSKQSVLVMVYIPQQNHNEGSKKSYPHPPTHARAHTLFYIYNDGL